ncbi:MAG TPA: phosphoribosylaminoimidazolesuccinocarboxamide synthase [Thermoplasmata archaeon]|nr:phosphoribosylaminoimidazolesuccinocarboxamide synthase [Thermoplasmata archaeon]
MFEKAKLIGKGKVKDIYETEDGNIIFHYTDRVTAFDGLKADVFVEKGRLTCELAAFWFDYLRNEGIENHFIDLVKPDAMMVEKLQILPIEVICRNFLTGTLLKRFKKGEVSLPQGMKGEEGEPFPEGGYIEFTTKFEERDRPVSRKEILEEKKWLSVEELNEVEEITRKVNTIMSDYLDSKGIILVDFKLEFGKDKNGKIKLADEVGTPDVCRFWLKEEFEKGKIVRLDKDVFRREDGNLIDAYSYIYNLIKGDNTT